MKRNEFPVLSLSRLQGLDYYKQILRYHEELTNYIISTFLNYLCQFPAVVNPCFQVEEEDQE